MKTVKQETRPGTENLEEEDTVALLERLAPAKRGKCRRGTKAVVSACVEPWTTHAITLDARVGVALSRARDFVAGRQKREAEVKQATEEVIRTARKLERKQQQK